jgi:hypothetical protein
MGASEVLRRQICRRAQNAWQACAEDARSASEKLEVPKSSLPENTFVLPADVSRHSSSSGSKNDGSDNVTSNLVVDVEATKDVVYPTAPIRGDDDDDDIRMQVSSIPHHRHVRGDAEAQVPPAEEPNETETSDTSRLWKHVFSGQLLGTLTEKKHDDDGCHNVWRLTVYLPHIKWPHYRFHWSCRLRRKDAPGYEQVWYTELSAREHVVSIFGMQRDAHTVTHRAVWLRATEKRYLFAAEKRYHSADMTLLTIESGYDWRGHTNVMSLHETAMHVPKRDPDPYDPYDFLAAAHVPASFGTTRLTDNIRLRSWTYKRRWLTQQCASRFYLLGDAFFRSHEHLAAHMTAVDMHNVLNLGATSRPELSSCAAYRPEAAHQDGWCTVNFDYARNQDAKWERLDWRKTRPSHASNVRAVQELEDDMRRPDESILTKDLRNARFIRRLYQRQRVREGATTNEIADAGAFEELEMDVAVERLLASRSGRYRQVDVTRESIHVTSLAHVRYEYTHVDDVSLRYSTVTDRQTQRRVLRFRRTDWQVAPRYRCHHNDSTCLDRLLGCHCSDYDISEAGTTASTSSTNEILNSTETVTVTKSHNGVLPTAIIEDRHYRCGRHAGEDVQVKWAAHSNTNIVTCKATKNIEAAALTKIEMVAETCESKLPSHEMLEEATKIATPREEVVVTAAACGTTNVFGKECENETEATTPKWDWSVLQDTYEGLQARNHQHESICVRSHAAQFRYATSKQMWRSDGTLIYDVDVTDTGTLDVRLSRLSQLDPAYWLVAYGIHIPIQLDIFTDTLVKDREKQSHCCPIPQSAREAVASVKRDGLRYELQSTLESGGIADKVRDRDESKDISEEALPSLGGSEDDGGETRCREHMAAFALHSGERHDKITTFVCPWTLSGDGWRVTLQCDIDPPLRPHILSIRTHCLGTDGAHSNRRRESRVSEGRRPEFGCCDAVAASSRTPLYDCMRSNEEAGHETTRYSCPHHDLKTIARISNFYALAPHTDKIMTAATAMPAAAEETKHTIAPALLEPSNEESSVLLASPPVSFTTETQLVSCEGEQRFMETRQGWRQTISLGDGTTQMFEVHGQQYGRTFVGGSDSQTPLSDRVRICTREARGDVRGQVRDVSQSIQEWERGYLPVCMHHPWRNLGLHIDRILRLTCDELDYHTSKFSVDSNVNDETKLFDTTTATAAATTVTPRIYEFCSLALHESFGDLATVATTTLAGSTDLTWLPNGRQHILMYIDACGQNFKTQRDSSNFSAVGPPRRPLANLAPSIVCEAHVPPNVAIQASTVSLPTLTVTLPTEISSSHEPPVSDEKTSAIMFVELNDDCVAFLIPDTPTEVETETCSQFSTPTAFDGGGGVCDTIHKYAASAAAHTILVSDWTLQEPRCVNLADHADVEAAAYSAGISVERWHKYARLGCDRVCKEWVSTATLPLDQLPCGLRSAYEVLQCMLTVNVFSERETHVLVLAFAILAADYSDSTRDYDSDRNRRTHARYHKFTRNSSTRDTETSRVHSYSSDRVEPYARRVCNDWYLSHGTSLSRSGSDCSSHDGGGGGGGGDGNGNPKRGRRIGWHNWCVKKNGANAHANGASDRDAWSDATKREAQAVRVAHRAVCAHLGNAQHPPEGLLKTRRTKVKKHDYGEVSDPYRDLVRRCASFLAPQTDVVLGQPFRVRDLENGYLLACETLGAKDCRRHRVIDLVEYKEPTAQPTMHVAAWSTIRRILKVGSAVSRKSTQTLETGIHRTTAYGRPTDDSYEIDEHNRLLVGSHVDTRKHTSPVSVYKLAADSLTSYPNPVVVEIALLQDSKLVSYSENESIVLVQPPLLTTPTSALESLPLPSSSVTFSLPAAHLTVPFTHSSLSSIPALPSLPSTPTLSSFSSTPVHPSLSSTPVRPSLSSTLISPDLSFFPTPLSFSSSATPRSLSSPLASPSLSPCPPANSSLTSTPFIRPLPFPSALLAPSMKLSPVPGPIISLDVPLMSCSALHTDVNSSDTTPFSASAFFASQGAFWPATWIESASSAVEADMKRTLQLAPFISSTESVQTLTTRESKRPLKLNIVLPDADRDGKEMLQPRGFDDVEGADSKRVVGPGNKKESKEKAIVEDVQILTELEEVTRNEAITRTLTDWNHTKLVLTLGRVRSIRPVCNQDGILVYLDEYRGEPCICCDDVASTVVQLCPCRLLLCVACSEQLVRKNDGKCMMCFGGIRGMHALDPTRKGLWKGVYKEAPRSMAYADSARRFSLQTAYSFIGIRDRGELIEYRHNQLVQVHDVKLRRGKCGPGISVFADAQDTLQYIPHFDVPDWARATTVPPPSRTSSSSSSSPSTSFPPSVSHSSTDPPS